MNGSREVSFHEVAGVLRKQISDGELIVGARLPSQESLAKEFGASRQVIRQALRVLQGDGLIDGGGKGIRPRVVEPAVPDEVPQPTLVALAPRLEAAFRAPEVRIDAVCLTAETLMTSMDRPIALVASKRAEPSSVKARIILPAKEHRLLYPAPLEGWGKDEDVDTAVHRRSERQHVSQVNVLWQQFETLRVGYGIPVEVSFRVAMNTPYQKIYLLNGEEALLAYYEMAHRTEEIDGEVVPLRDASGTQSLLFPFEARHGGRDASFVNAAQRWFDRLWESLKTDVDIPMTMG